MCGTEYKYILLNRWYDKILYDLIDFTYYIVWIIAIDMTQAHGTWYLIMIYITWLLICMILIHILTHSSDMIDAW